MTRLPPIIERELNLRARRSGTYWIRLAVAALGMLVCLPILMTGEGATPAYVGRFGFAWLTGAAFVLCAAACLLTADLLSSERRDGTLGLLLLTRVRVFEIVVGKLASVGLVGLWGLTALLPVLTLPVLAGGVTGREAFCRGLVLLDLLFLSLVTGLWASARRLEAVRAARLALGMTALLVLAPALAEAFAHSVKVFTSGVGLLSPLTALCYSNPTSTPEAVRFAVSLLIVQGWGWYLLARTSKKLRESFSAELVESSKPPEPSSEPPPTSLPVVPLPEVPDAIALAQERRKAGDDDPIEWLVLHQRTISSATFPAAFLSSVPYLLGWMAGFPMALASTSVVAQPVNLIFMLIVVALVARGAGWFLYEARRTGQLELLLTTPYGAATILIGQCAALKKLLIRPFATAVFTIILLTFANAIRQTGAFRQGDDFWFVLAPIGLAANLACLGLSIVAACWLGMWSSLEGYSPLLTMARVAGLVAGIPFLFTMGVTLSGALLFPVAYASKRSSLALLVMVLAAVQITYLLALIERNRRRVRERLLEERAGFA